MTSRQRRPRNVHASDASADRGEWLTDGQVLPLRWRPWYLERLARADGVAWVWPVLQAACDLDDPEHAEVVTDLLDAEDLAMMSRYVAVVDRLLATTAINAPATARLSLMDGAVAKNVPADDATLGFAALLRQLFKDGEEASFARVRKALSRATHAQGADAASQVLVKWKRAHQIVLTRQLRSLIHDLAIDAGLLSEEDDGGRVLTTDDPSPQELLQTYLYGDLLHWGDGRSVLARWNATEAGAAGWEIEMRTDANVLAHFYAGFAGLVRRFLSSAESQQVQTPDESAGLE